MLAINSQLVYFVDTILDNWQLVDETQQVPTIDQQALLAQMHDAKELRKERDRARKRNMSEEQRSRAKELAYVSFISLYLKILC